MQNNQFKIITKKRRYGQKRGQDTYTLAQPCPKIHLVLGTKMPGEGKSDDKSQCQDQNSHHYIHLTYSHTPNTLPRKNDSR